MLIFAINRSLLAMGVTLTVLGPASARAAIFIDRFTDPTDGSQFVQVDSQIDQDFLESENFPETILGGYRDLEIQVIQSTIRGRGTVEVDGENLNWSNDVNFQSQVKVTWDGMDGSPEISYQGLGGIDLTQENTLEGILLEATNDLPGLTITLDIYSDETKLSRAMAILAEANPSIGEPRTLFFPFATGFTPQEGGGADFSSVGAIQLLLEGPANMDSSIQLIRADRDPERTEVPEPASLLNLLSLGVLGVGSVLSRRFNRDRRSR